MIKPKQIFAWSGVVLELAGVLLITKATATASSPALGIVMLGLGLLIVSLKSQQKPGAAQNQQPENLSTSVNTETSII